MSAGAFISSRSRARRPAAGGCSREISGGSSVIWRLPSCSVVNRGRGGFAGPVPGLARGLPDHLAERLTVAVLREPVHLDPVEGPRQQGLAGQFAQVLLVGRGTGDGGLLAVVLPPAGLPSG